MGRFDEVEVIDETVPAYRKVGMLVGFAPPISLVPSSWEVLDWLSD